MIFPLNNNSHPCPICSQPTFIENEIKFIDKVAARIEQMPFLVDLDKHEIWEMAYMLVKGTIQEHIEKSGAE